MKRTAALVLAVLMLSGCVPHTELDKLGIAEAVGVDFDGGEYTVTVQYFNTDSSGGVTAVDSSAPNVTTVSGTGETIESALGAASYASGSGLMLGAAAVIVFGEDALFSLREPLKLAMSHYSGNPRAYITAAKGKAADIMNVRFSEGSASVEKLEMLLKNADDLGLTRPMRMCEALERLFEPTGSVILPLLEVSELNGGLTEDGSGVVVSGGVLCKNGAYARELSDMQMSGVHLLDPAAGSTCACELMLSLRGHDTRVMLYGITPRITPEARDGRLSIDVRIYAECKIVSTSLPDPYLSRDELDRLAEEELCRRVTAALTTATEHGADPFGMEYAIRSHSPELWRAISADYPGYLTSASVAVSSTVSTDRYGITR